MQLTHLVMFKFWSGATPTAVITITSMCPPIIVAKPFNAEVVAKPFNAEVVAKPLTVEIIGKC